MSENQCIMLNQILKTAVKFFRNNRVDKKCKILHNWMKKKGHIKLEWSILVQHFSDFSIYLSHIYKAYKTGIAHMFG